LPFALASWCTSLSTLALRSFVGGGDLLLPEVLLIAGGDEEDSEVDEE
jgi:hypothetical protein